MERTKNIFDKIGSLIPGYTGYVEREGRRQSDKILRQKVVSVIDKCEHIVQDRLAKELNNRCLNQITAVEECRKRLNNLSSKIKYSPYGESSFFSDSQIKEVELSEIFKKDLSLMTKVISLNESIQDMPTEKINSVITEINQHIEDRNQFIKEYK